ncbi:hypothetical protein GCM10008019_02400 [Deinococcus soli (ex Cha et al. 2016)]|nr:hypothetical protein GCM10008019_02400 [Deinococcus soli (ex Cha et al. 2016)]
MAHRLAPLPPKEGRKVQSSQRQCFPTERHAPLPRLALGGTMTRLKGKPGGSGGRILLILVLLIVLFLLAYFLYLKPQGLLNLGF